MRTGCVLSYVVSLDAAETAEELKNHLFFRKGTGMRPDRKLQYKQLERVKFNNKSSSARETNNNQTYRKTTRTKARVLLRNSVVFASIFTSYILLIRIHVDVDRF